MKRHGLAAVAEMVDVVKVKKWTDAVTFLSKQRLCLLAGD